MQAEHNQSAQPLLESEAVSWWNWRPGMRPLYALLLGGLLSLLALFLLVNGITALLARMLDYSSAPVQVPGIVAGHSQDLLGSHQLTLHLQQPGFPSSITLVVVPSTARALPDGSSVIVDYAPHQHIPYAIRSGSHLYTLSSANPISNLLQTLALLLFGLLLLPYPALLLFWGWHDLRAGRLPARVGRVVTLRAARQTTTRTPGLLPRTTRIWYGVAIQLDRSAHPEPEILAFGISQELYEQLRRGTRVEVCYSPCLHHLYVLKVLYNASN